ncbi:MAG: HEAT repeat domain-containing protein [Anaerolineae bacterium]|nr:HEAT repeat domain-containing protein [Anaerolineae bacterium]
MQDPDRQARIAAARRAEAPILAELAQVGIHINTLGDLKGPVRLDILREVDKRGIPREKLPEFLQRGPVDYRAGISVLLKWLPLVDNLDVKWAIVDALAWKWAKPVAARPLIEEFRKTPMERWGFKWSIASALCEVADASVFDDIVELVRDKRHGRAREMLAVALAKTKDPRAVDVLIELLDDEEIAGHAVYALRLLAPPEARSALERFVDHPKTWVRNEAKRALAKIDKKLARSGKKQ